MEVLARDRRTASNSSYGIAERRGIRKAILESYKRWVRCRWRARETLEANSKSHYAIMWRINSRLMIRVDDGAGESLAADMLRERWSINSWCHDHVAVMATPARVVCEAGATGERVGPRPRGPSEAQKFYLKIVVQD